MRQPLCTRFTWDSHGAAISPRPTPTEPTRGPGRLNHVHSAAHRTGADEPGGSGVSTQL